jgi:nucleoside-diphosphate kinase
VVDFVLESRSALAAHNRPTTTEGAVPQMSKSELQQTLVLIKPDAMKNSLTGYVLSLLSEFHTGLRFAATKIVHVNRMLAEEHYAEHRGKVFYPFLLDYIVGKSHYPDEPASRRIVAIVYQGVDAVSKVRGICGPTDPLEARQKKPGSIRSLGALVTIRDGKGEQVGLRMDNLIHASATSSDAEREIKLWFKPTDMPPSMRPYSVEESSLHYYYLEGKLDTEYEQNATCLLAPGDIAWQSDLQALRALRDGKESPCTLEAIVAKYLINHADGDEA